VLDRARHRAHSRVEISTLKAVTVLGLGFPHASQVLQVTRKTRDLRSRRWQTVVVYAVTSLAPPGPALPGWRTCYVGTGRLRTGCTGCGT
jgi:hypothetical protein